MQSLYAEPYGPAREKARINAKESSQSVDVLYKDILVLMTKAVLTGDKEHDDATVFLFKEAHLQWKRFRETRCTLDTQLDVYPIGSRLYAQTYYYCVNEKNREYKKYLLNIKAELTTSN